VARQPGGTLLLTSQLSVDSQVRLYANAYGPGGARPTFLQNGSVLGVPLHGVPTKTARAQLLQPGTVTVRLRLSARGLKPGSTGKVVVTAIDPWGRRASFGLGFRTP